MIYSLRGIRNLLMVRQRFSKGRQFDNADVRQLPILDPLQHIVKGDCVTV